MSHLTLIESPQGSEVEAYLQKVLKSSMEGKAELNGSDSEMKTPRKKEKEVRNFKNVQSERFESLGYLTS